MALHRHLRRRGLNRFRHLAKKVEKLVQVVVISDDAELGMLTL